MYVITASSEKFNWISGIFKEEKNAYEYYKSISVGLKENQKIIKLEAIEYPFYIIEKDDFEYVNRNEMIKRLSSIDVSEDEDKVYFNIYTIESDYKANKPGTDYMGILSHDHITNDFLDWYKKEGISFLIRRGICK